MENSISLVKVLVLAERYEGKVSSFLKHMVLDLPSSAYMAKVCYLKGAPDGKNSLDSLGRAIYLEKNGSALGVIASLVKLLKNEKPQILHCHRHKATLYGAIAARLAGVPIVISHHHGTPLKRLMNLRRRIISSFIYRWVTSIITVSGAGKKDILLAGFTPKKVLTLWNGIDLERFGKPFSKDVVKKNLGILPGEVVFGTVGRLSHVKGHSYLLDAFAEVLKKAPNSRLVIAGDGPLREELEKKAQALGVSLRVLFLGRREDIPELLCGFDIFVFPSFREGFGLALTEAMASRLPVVVSDGGALPEVFGEGGFGKMFPAGDSKALSEAMIEVAMLPEDERRRMGEAARRRVEEEFTKEVMCKHLLDIYGELLRRSI